MKKVFKFLMAALGGFAAVAFYSNVVFAEGDILCSGRITGTTNLSNMNAGKISFDAHEPPAGPGQPAEDGIVADLSIVLGAGINGLAPANRENAACIDDEPGTFDRAAYDFKVKGWAWNTNGGFTSFSCEGGVNDAGEGAGTACGNIDYGTYIRPADPDDQSRQLFGYAWNPTFGWIQLQGKGTAPIVSANQTLDVGESIGVVLDGQMYEVFLQTNNPIGESTIAVNGQTQVLDLGQKAQYGDVFLEVIDMEYFEGPSPHLTFRLETVVGSEFDYGVSVDANGVSSGYAWTQAGVYVNFAGLKFHFPGDANDQPANNPALGDWCDDKAFICLEADPDPAGLNFGADLNGAPKIADGKDGYLAHLYLRDKNGNALDPADYQLDPFLASIKLNWKDTVKINQLFIDPINEVGNILESIKAPWSEAKAVGATVFKPLAFGDFVEVGGDPGHYVSADKVKSFAPTTDSKLSATTSTKPTFYVKNEDFLYDLGLGKLEPNDLILKSITYGDLKDSAGKIVLNQGVVYPNGKPGMYFKFRPAMLVNTLFANDLQDKILAYRSIPMNFKVGTDIIGSLAQSTIDSAMVEFALGYSKEETALQDSCQGDNVLKNFDFSFVTDLSGKDISAAPKTSLSERLKLLMNPNGINIQAVASLIGYVDGNPGACDIAAGANLYTTIQYKVDDAHSKVAYGDNKLPRVAGDAILNPVLVVHGNILTQGSSSVRADERVQTSGNVSIGIIRDTINENLEKNVGDVSIREDGKCSVTGLGVNPSVNNCPEYYKTFSIGDEKVLYFRNSDVYLDFVGGAFTGKWAVISDGGNIFFDGDAYNAVVADNNRLSVVALRSNVADKYFGTGNVYINPGVKNIQATIIADGSVFSYSGDKAKIDPDNGEPVWGSYVEMTNALASQLLIDGAVYSDNGIGTSSLDQGQNPKDFILAGGGKVIGGKGKTISLEERMSAQFYDLNYLRMFRLALKTSASGLPIDMKCNRAWTAEDQASLAKGLTVCGEKPCDPKEPSSQPFACDGINPLLKYDANATPDGDLAVPQNQDGLAKGLNNNVNTGTDFDPVYIFYRPAEKTSFIFSKAGAINIGGN